MTPLSRGRFRFRSVLKSGYMLRLIFHASPGFYPQARSKDALCCQSLQYSLRGGESPRIFKSNRYKRLFFSAVLCFLFPLSVSAALGAESQSVSLIEGCVGLFKKIPGFRPPLAPRRIWEAQKITGLTGQEIKGSVIVSAGGNTPTSDFVVWTAREMGARKALVLDMFQRRTPDHFFMWTHPLLTPQNPPRGTLQGMIPFHHSSIRQRLGGEYADITLVLSVFGQFRLADTKLWLQQMIKITKPGGLVILNLEKSSEKVTPAEFQDILRQMKTEGVVSAYSTHSTKFNNLLMATSPEPSVTYRIVTSNKPSLSDGFREHIDALEQARGAPSTGRTESEDNVLPFPHPSRSKEE